MDVKHAISRPQIATTLRRFSNLYSFGSALPPILTDLSDAPCEPTLNRLRSHLSEGRRDTSDPLDSADVINGSAREEPSKTSAEPSPRPHVGSLPASREPNADASTSRQANASAPVQYLGGDDSTTEPSSDEAEQSGTQHRPAIASAAASKENSPPHKTASEHSQPPGAGSRDVDRSSSPDTSPERPQKKLKPRSSGQATSDSSSGDEGKSKAPSNASRAGSNAPTGRGGSSVRGVRQPLKRGVKRF